MNNESGLPERKAELKIETIRTPEGNEVSYCPERGGIITSLKFDGVECLYMDTSTFNDLNLSVKGGIPTLFPNAGPADKKPDGKFPKLPKHGFARDMRWRGHKWRDGFEEDLLADNETKKVFPYDFKLSVSGQFTSDGFFTIIQKVDNQGEGDMGVSEGLHPYLFVPFGNKAGIRFNFEGGEAVQENITLWANGEAYFIDNPKVKDGNAIMEIIIPEQGTILIDASPLYKRIWIWSLPGKDFVCVEPVMRDAGGLAEDPHIIPEGGQIEPYMKIKFIPLKKEPHIKHKITSSL